MNSAFAHRYAVPASAGSDPPRHRLDAVGCVAIDPDACLAMRPAGNDCRLCAQSCVPAALTWSADALPQISDACVGCGRCASVCPTGALDVTGCQIEPQAGQQVLRLECQRVPAALAGAATLIPCLGGLSSLALLDYLALAPERQVHCVDRGWCADCPASTGVFAVDQTLARTRTLLDAVSAPAPSAVSVVSLVTDPALALPLYEVRRQRSVSRRRFFVGLSDELAELAAPPVQAPHPSGAARRASPRIQRGRQRLAQTLQALASRHRSQLPAAVYPQVSVSDGCDLSGVCAAVCPSGALHLEQAPRGTWRALSFHPALCVDCGLCEKTCPSRALTLRPAGAVESEASSSVVLHSLALQACARCGQSFLRLSAATTCPSCRTERALLDSLFSSAPTARVPDGPASPASNFSA